MSAVNNLKQAVEGWSAALAADSLNPQPSYKIDDKAVSRAEWRQSLIEAIKETNAVINSLSPYWLQTRVRT